MVLFNLVVREQDITLFLQCLKCKISSAWPPIEAPRLSAEGAKIGGAVGAEGVASGEGAANGFRIIRARKSYAGGT